MEKAPTSHSGNPLFPGSKYARLTELPPERLDHVRDMLRRGSSPLTVAKTIQAWGLCLDVSEIGLSRMLSRYCKDEITDIEIVEAVDPKTVTSLKKRVARHANVLDEFSDAILIQKARVAMAYEKEKLTKFPLQITNDCMIIMGRLLKDYGDLAVKFGLVSRMLREDENSQGPRFEPKRLEEALTNTFVQKELLGIVESMLTELDGDAERLQPDGDSRR